MIIFLADGRLGNQIFQYVFLKTIQIDNEKIIVSGFEDFKEVFEVKDFINFNKKNQWIRVFVFRVCKPLLHFLSDKKLISSIVIDHEKILGKYRRESITYTKKKGFLNFIIFVKPAFFQSDKFFVEKTVNKLNIKKLYLNIANDVLESVPEKSHKIFVHIRRGDYKYHTVYGKDTLLPIEYFRERIEWFLKNREDSFFIFLSDEPEFVKKEFYDIQNKVISYDHHTGTDLAIMTQCNSAILSPSSFGWWGSYLMENRDVVFAPKYWLGFNSKIVYPSNPLASFFKEVEIK